MTDTDDNERPRHRLRDHLKRWKRERPERVRRIEQKRAQAEAEKQEHDQ